MTFIIHITHPEKTWDVDYDGDPLGAMAEIESYLIHLEKNETMTFEIVERVDAGDSNPESLFNAARFKKILEVAE